VKNKHHNLNDNDYQLDLEYFKQESLVFRSEDEDVEATPYQIETLTWINQQPREDQNTWDQELKIRRIQFYATAVFSVFAGTFMGLGTLYLIAEPLTMIPLLASLPFLTSPLIIIPLAGIAAIAYGLLTFNALFNLLQNETIQKWGKDILQGFFPKAGEARSLKGIFLAVSLIVLVALAVTLTVFTAGTWMTIAEKTKPLFDWLSAIPSFVMGWINPFVTGASTVAFNLQNTATTRDLIQGEFNARESLWSLFKTHVSNSLETIQKTENKIQWFNPFRIILKLTLIPLLVLLFLGHIVTIAVTGDRMPGLHPLLCCLCDGFDEIAADGHYFLPKRSDSHDCESHDHENNLPTLLLKASLTPLMFLAALWHTVAGWNFDTRSAFNNAFIDAFKEQWSGKKAKTDACDHHAHNECAHAQAPTEPHPTTSPGWERQYAKLNKSNDPRFFDLGSRENDSRTAAFQRLDPR